IAVADTSLLMQSGDGRLTCYGTDVRCPTSVGATASGPDIILGWIEPVAGTYPISSYRVERATSATGPFATIALSPVGSTIYVDGGFASANNYYRIIAIDTAANESSGCETFRISGA